MRILLIEPRYYSKYPPLGLLKLAAYHKKRGDEVKFVRGFELEYWNPDKIYITSLFTYAWRPVHEVIRFYIQKYPNAEIVIGGIYATLCSDHLRKTFGDSIRIYRGLFEEAENFLPDYSLFPSWDKSLVFSSRGCIRKCPFCAVSKLEPKFQARKSIRHLILPSHSQIILWDNNILASPYWRDIFRELAEIGLPIDFNQGLDARLITPEVVSELQNLKLSLIHLAYDSIHVREPLQRAIELLKKAGFPRRNIVVYCLFNGPLEDDNPENFLIRIQDLMTWGVVSYPMRFEPLEPREKGTFISAKWTAEQLEMIAQARRVLGWGGAFPPYEGLKKKFLNAQTFEEAFELAPRERVPQRQYPLFQ